MKLLKLAGLLVLAFFVWKAYDAGGWEGIWNWFDSLMTRTFDWLENITHSAQGTVSTPAETLSPDGSVVSAAQGVSHRW